ncbi:MAG: Asp-tRNA(Asn)/Glu-tRNA(Gln) amidotransferase subunit GatC [Candidatus Omnitrophica bacterium]|nr:Asp-tRNA(Asn)/Glu-tRNA(Gln) amidotransferase subunit GatC [Candidatus Omnitrophota bacterium]
MPLEESQVQHVARLARIRLTPEEIHEMTTQLDKIVGYVGELDGVDTADVEPTFHVLPVHNVFRPDEIQASLDPEAALASAPKRSGTSFQVPTVIEEA